MTAHDVEPASPFPSEHAPPLYLCGNYRTGPLANIVSWRGDPVHYPGRYHSKLPTCSEHPVVKRDDCSTSVVTSAWQRVRVVKEYDSNTSGCRYHMGSPAQVRILSLSLPFWFFFLFAIHPSRPLNPYLS